MKRDDLNETLTDIALLKPDYDMNHFEIGHIRPKAGPNRWLEVKGDPEAHGENFDFRILDDDVFMPCCLAAQHYVWAHFSEDATFYNDLTNDYTGVVITPKFGYSTEETVLHIVGRARLSGLISEDEYCAAMNDRDARAGK